MRTCEECQLLSAEVYPRQGEITLCDVCDSDRYVTCIACSATGLRDEYIPGDHEGFCCFSCHSRTYIFCFDCGKVVRRHVAQEFHGNSYCSDCPQGRTQTCDRCHECHVDCVDNYSGVFCAQCWETCFSDCNYCSNSYSKTELHELESGEYICNHCEMEIPTWDAIDFVPLQSHYEEIGSKRTFGIEIETSNCKGFSSLKNKIIWACTDDFSIAGKEFITPTLYGDEGLQEIRSFCKKANDLEWKSDTNCGLHLHMGIGDLSPEELKRLAFAYLHTYKLWRQFISARRANNSMCGPPGYPFSEITKIDIQDSEEWEYFAAERDRFDAINWRAYLTHGTIELRLLNGTLDAELICNWIKTHTRFVDFVIKHTIDELELMLDGSILYQFSALTEIIGSDLATYYVGVADTYQYKVRSDLESCCPV